MTYVMAAVYPGMKPMLEFVRMPDQAEIKRRRRRYPVRTPENPKVKIVPLCFDNVSQQPHFKWVSPQFDIETVTNRPKPKRGLLEIKTSKKTARSLCFEQDESLHISIYPSLAPHLINKQGTDQSLDTHTIGKESDCSSYHQPTTQDSSADQTVPEVTYQTVDQIALDLSDEEHGQQPSTDDLDVTTMSECLGGGCSVGDLSQLVGNMSLDDPVEHSISHAQCGERAGKECSVSCATCNREFACKDAYAQSQDANKQTVQGSFHCNINSVHKTLPFKTSFKPSSASTPSHHKDFIFNENSCLDSCTKLYNSTIQPPSKDSCILQLTDATSSYHDKKLKSYEFGAGSEESEDSGFVLAAETPQHLWLSPEVKVINNTFS